MKNIKQLSFCLILSLMLILIYQPVLARDNITDSMINLINESSSELEAYNPETTSPEMVAGRIISTLLTFLGIVFFLLIIYGGFMWMTAAGNEEQVEKAKKIIIRATIGLLVVLMALTITYFVLRELVLATTA